MAIETNHRRKTCTT